MTSTDRAFIAAFQQQDVAGAPASVFGDATPEPLAPHFTASPTKSRRAPLSDHLARRRSAATPPEQPINAAPLKPGIEVDALPWPPLVDQLVDRGRNALLDVLARVSNRPKASDTPRLIVVGSQPGVGATTALLATAKLVSGLGGRVAIVDAAPCATSAAALLGVHRTAALEDSRLASQSLAIDDLLVASRKCRTSVFAASDGPVLAGLIEAAVERLAATHDLVLVDAGQAEQIGPGVFGLAAAADTILVDSATSRPAFRVASVARLREAGVPVAGVIESLQRAA